MFCSSNENLLLKQVRVSFDQNNEPFNNNERYEYTFGAYLEVRISSSLMIFFSFVFRTPISVLFVVVLLAVVGQLLMMVKIPLRIPSSVNLI